METHGALLGWKHVDLGDKVMLVVQSTCSPGDDLDELRLLMTKNQALVLGNYLTQISGKRAPLREERQALLDRVTAQGYIDDYAGIRISAKGRRFRIARAVVWNLVDAGGHCHGQAAMFRP